MKKEDYIKAIEKLNNEFMELYHSPEYREIRRKYKIKTLLKNGEFKKLFQLLRSSMISRVIQYPKIRNETNLEMKKRTGKKVVYTCISSNYDCLVSPLITTDKTDYVVFSDNEEIIANTSNWQFKQIPENIKRKCHNNPILINRYIKMHPKEVLPGYDLALYIDGSIMIISDIEECFYYINDKTGLAMHDHYKRNNVYEESIACMSQNLGNKKKIKELIKQYRLEGFPEDYGLFEATLIASDLNNKKSSEILDLWWKSFIKSGTLRDQLTFTYVLWKNDYQYEDIGLLGYNASSNPKFRRIEHEKNKVIPKKRLNAIKRLLKNRMMGICKTKFYIIFLRPITIKMKKVYFYGKRYQCNICGSSLKKLLSGGQKNEIFQNNTMISVGYRKKCICPVCKSKDGERLVYYYIKNHTDILTGRNTVLHFAPDLETKKRIKKNKMITYFSDEINNEKKDTIVDITNMDFEDNTFDYIICNHVLEHAIDEQKAILELKRVIKKDGIIILTVPICPSNSKTIEGNSTNQKESISTDCHENDVRLYGNDFVSRIKKYGLQVKKYDFEKEEGKKKRDQYGILKQEIIYLINK